MPAVLASGLAAGEPFGTCNDCFVHACPRHGERGGQYFRCADCVGASAVKRALRADPGEIDLDTVRASSPRLAAASASLRSRFDGARMGLAIFFLRRRMASGEPFIGNERQDMGGERLAGAELLALEGYELDTEAAETEALLRAALIDAELRSSIAVESYGFTDPYSDRLRVAGEVAVFGLAVAYTARGVDEPGLSPFAMRGGLTLPASLVTIGHAYAIANDVLA